MNDQYDMPESHAATLRQITGTPEGNPLPELLEAKYWELKRCCDRISVRISDQSLAFLGMMGGFGKPNARESAPPSVVDLHRRGEVKHGDPVSVAYRNSQRSGKFVGVTAGGEVIVQMDSDGEERQFTPDKVTLPEPVAA